MPYSSSRRGLLRAGASVVGLGVVGSLSGCLGGGGSGKASRIGMIPAGTTVAVHVDVAGLLSNQQLRQTINEVAAQASGESGPTLTVKSALDRVEQQVGLDPRKVTEVLAFGSQASGSQGREKSGLVFWANWSPSELERIIKQRAAEISTGTYRNKTVYGADSPSQLAVLSEGTYVAGTRAAVRDVIDLQAGKGKAVGGEVRKAYKAAKGGYVRVAFDVPTSQLSGGTTMAQTARTIKYGYGSVFKKGSGMGASMTVRAESGDAAKNIKQQLDGALTVAQSQLSEMEGRPQLRSRMSKLLESTQVVRNGKTVTVRNTNSGGELMAVVLGAVVASFVLDLGTQQSQTAPQAAFEFDFDSQAGTLSVTHNGGESIPASRLFLRGSGLAQTGSWRELGGSTSGDVDGRPAVVAGDDLTVGAQADYEANLVWQSVEGDMSATLAADTGPEA